MKFTRHRFLLLAAGAAVLSTVSLAFSDRGAWSQTGRTIKIVVTFPKNSGASNLTQALADQIARAQGTIVVVENESAPTGTEAVAHAVRDGSTLLVINNNFVVDSHFRKPAYDPLADFEPICSLASAQTLVVVSGSSPYRTLVDLISAAREKPGEVTMAGNPRGTTHLGMEALRLAAKVEMPFVPLVGATAVVGVNAPLDAVLSGRATWSIQTYQNSLEHLRTGKLRALATASRQRLEPLPELPTVAESGYKDYEVDLWDGVFAPAKTPNETISQLASWFAAALQIPEVRSKIRIEAFIPVGLCGADFIASIRKQHDQYGRIIREADIKAQ